MAFNWKTNLMYSYDTMAKKNESSTSEDSVYIPTIQISQKDKESKIRLSWGIECAIRSPTVVP